MNDKRFYNFIIIEAKKNVKYDDGIHFIQLCTDADNME